MIRKKPLFVAVFIIATMTTAIARGQIQSIQKPPQQQKVPVKRPPLLAPMKLEITGLRATGLRKNPSHMLVTWTEEMRPSVRVVQYQITLILSGEGLKEQTTQYANSGAKNFAISLDRIPASKRAQVFNGQHFYRADVIVKAHYADNGRTGFVEDKYNIAIAPPSLDGIFK